MPLCHYAIRHIHPSRPSVTSIRHVHPSHPSVTSILLDFAILQYRYRVPDDIQYRYGIHVYVPIMTYILQNNTGTGSMLAYLLQYM